MSDASTPPAPSPETRIDDDGKASGPLRALAVVMSLALLFGVAVMVIVAINPDNIPLCADVESGDAKLGPTFECFDQSSASYNVQKVVAAGAALVGALAALLGFYVGATGRRGDLMLKLTGAAVVLGGVAVLVGQL